MDYYPASHTSTIIEQEPVVPDEDKFKTGEKDVATATSLALDKPDPFLVTLDADDPLNPMVCRRLPFRIPDHLLTRTGLVTIVSMVPNRGRRYINFQRVREFFPTFTCLFTFFLLLYRTFASSAPSNVLPQMMTQFGFSQEVATLSISLFIAGYCVGPLFWGPLSEQVRFKL